MYRIQFRQHYKKLAIQLTLWSVSSDRRTDYTVPIIPYLRSQRENYSFVFASVFVPHTGCLSRKFHRNPTKQNTFLLFTLFTQTSPYKSIKNYQIFTEKKTKPKYTTKFIEERSRLEQTTRILSLIFYYTRCSKRKLLSKAIIKKQTLST